jgi:hypothetical protein
MRKRFFGFLSLVGNVVAVVTFIGLVATGAGVVIAVYSGSITGLHGVSRGFFIAGMGLLTAGVVGLAVKIGLAFLPLEVAQRIAYGPPDPAVLQRADALEARAREQEERDRRSRRTAQEVLTTLEYQRDKLMRLDLHFAPMHQGIWPTNRESFFEDVPNAEAGRLTERAFIALGIIEPPLFALSPGRDQAIEAIDRAVPALEAVAGIKP